MQKVTAMLLAIYIMAASFAHYEKLSAVENKLKTYEAEIASLRDAVEERRFAPVVKARFLLKTPPPVPDPIDKRTLTVTAYSPRPLETDGTPWQTASCKRVREGIVAVSRDLYERGWGFGKKVYVEDHGVFTIDDLMSSSKKQCIDIFMLNTDKALEFGKKRLAVVLLEA